MNTAIRSPQHTGTPDKAIAALVGRQHGAFTRTQALGKGFTASAIQVRLQSGRWERIHEGVYRLAGARVTSQQEIMAILLLAGPGAVASHRCAAWLLKLPGGRPTPEITLLKGGRTRLPATTHRSANLPAADVVAVDGIRTTSLSRTVIDLADVASPEELEQVLDAVLSMGVNVGHIQERMDKVGQCRRGTPVLRGLLGARGAGGGVPASVLESKLKPLVASLPGAVWGRRVGVGGKQRFLDVSWGDIKLMVEVDGWDNHSGRAQFQQDLNRQNDLVALGWTVLRFTWQDVTERPERVRATIVRVAAQLAAPAPTVNPAP